MKKKTPLAPQPIDAGLPMVDVMLDLETLGRRAGCAILSIGAVAFDHVTGKLGDEIYVVVNRRSCAELGLHEDDGTLAWWAGQTEVARQVLEDASDERKSVPLDRALAQFTAFVDHHGGRDCKVWGNGADFDNAIMASCYAAVKQGQPWDFCNNRCFRTLKSLVRSVLSPRRVGTHHNALDDAKTQAAHAVLLLQQLYAV